MKKITEKEQPEFWFNTQTQLVEVGKQVLALYRIGPFASRKEAENAMQTLRERSQIWSDEDNEDQ